MKSWKLVALGILVLSSGCVNLKPPENLNLKYQYLSPIQRQERLKDIHCFSVEGSFSILKASKRLIIDNHFWVESNKHLYKINISSVLNLFQITIFGCLGSKNLWKINKKKMTASTARLLENKLKLQLPISNLYYWIRSLPGGPSQKIMKFDSYGHLKYLVQNGWHVKYKKYVSVEGYDFPVKMEIIRHGIRVIILMKHWILNKKTVY